MLLTTILTACSFGGNGTAETEEDEEKMQELREVEEIVNEISNDEELDVMSKTTRDFVALIKVYVDDLEKNDYKGEAKEIYEETKDTLDGVVDKMDLDDETLGLFDTNSEDALGKLIDIKDNFKNHKGLNEFVDNQKKAIKEGWNN